MTIFFISDLHLDGSRPEMAEMFLRFLKEATVKAKALYILGDFFEVWVGDDDDTPFNRMIIAALKDATSKGLPIYFQHGNRDFLLGKKFFKVTGCKLLPEEYVVNVYGTPILLMHGDQLCTLDKPYMRFRKRARIKLYQYLIFLWKPLKRRREIANYYRHKSENNKGAIADYVMDVAQDEVERKMQKHSILHLVHGHTHKQAIHTFNLQDQTATRTVLGAWHELGNALQCDPSGSRQFIVIK